MIIVVAIVVLVVCYFAFHTRGPKVGDAFTCAAPKCGNKAYHDKRTIEAKPPYYCRKCHKTWAEKNKAGKIGCPLTLFAGVLSVALVLFICFKCI